MPAIYAGPIQVGCHVLRTHKSYQIGRGWVWNETQRGTPDQVLSALAVYQSMPNYVEFSITPEQDGVLDRIDAVWAENATESTWEVKPVEMQADMLLYAHFNGRLTDEQVNLLHSADNEFTTDPTASVSDTETSLGKVYADTRTKEYFQLMKRGEKYRQKNTCAITLQELNSDRGSLWVSTLQVDKVMLTNAQSALLGVGYDFGTFEGMPYDFASGLPNDAISIANPTLVYGWLKGFPTLTRAPWGKWQRQQMWTYGLWSTEVYDCYPALAKPV